MKIYLGKDRQNAAQTMTALLAGVKVSLEEYKG
jgi:hypothetical protein